VAVNLKGVVYFIGRGFESRKYKKARVFWLSII
jgi:hypothetical protein